MTWPFPICRVGASLAPAGWSCSPFSCNGYGWYSNGHTWLGLPFPADRVDEAKRIIRERREPGRAAFTITPIDARAATMLAFGAPALAGSEEHLGGNP